MAERIRAIITGYDVFEQGEVHDDARSGELTNYPILPPEASYGPFRATLNLFLDAFVKAHSLGRVLGDGTAFSLNTAGETGIKDPLSPDIAFVSFERLPASAYLDRVVGVTPELVVEVVLPSDSVEAVQDKVTLYLDGGVSQVWLVAPHVQEVLVFAPEDRDGARLTIEDNLKGEGPLAGFSIPVRAIFGENNALQVEVLRKLISA